MAFKLALGELRHGWKHFLVFVTCLMLGVAIMGSVGSFGSIVGNALQGEAKTLLGGDVEVRIRGAEATTEQLDLLKSYGKISHVTTLRSMLYKGDDSTLVEVKAIDAAYPLVGKLELNENISRKEALSGNGIIVDSILLAQLGLKIGDGVKLGNSSYIVRATLKKEPDRAVQIFTFGPRVMLSQEELAASGLVNRLSMVENRYRILTPGGAVVDEAFEKKMEELLQKRFPEVAWRVNIGTDGNETVGNFTNQLLSFLVLSGLATFLIAGIGIGSSARSYLEKKLQTIAIFKVLGAPRRTLLQTYIMVLGILALAGGLAGILISVIIVKSALPLVMPILPVLSGHTGITLPPLLLALWYGLLIVYLFSLPAILSALNISPSLLFRSKAGILLLNFDCYVLLSGALLAGALLATLLFTSHNIPFMAGAIAVMLVAFALFGACGFAVRRAARRIKVKKPWLRLAVGNLHRPGSTTGTVIFAIGISLTVLITLTLTETNFQARIKRLMEEQAPSLFMLDIQPFQKDGLNRILLEYAGKEQIMLYPMARGRISAINGVPVKESDVADDVRWAVRGDRGISTSPTLPENARVVKGAWWPENYSGPPLLSVDERFLKGMKLEIGSNLTLNILGEEITAKIASARRIDYSTLQINFSLMLSPGVIDNFPLTYISTIHLGKNQDKEPELIKRISRALPGITIIRTSEVVELVRDIIGNIGIALRIAVAISLFAGLLVLVSALSATIEQRLYDTAILKVLGARQRDILKACTAEWTLLALITSVIAAAIGTFSAWVITLYFRGDFYPMPEVTLLTIAACIFVVWVTGYTGNRRLFNIRPASLLRNE